MLFQVRRAEADRKKPQTSRPAALIFVIPVVLRHGDLARFHFLRFREREGNDALMDSGADFSAIDRRIDLERSAVVLRPRLSMDECSVNTGIGAAPDDGEFVILDRNFESVLAHAGHLELEQIPRWFRLRWLRVMKRSSRLVSLPLFSRTKLWSFEFPFFEWLRRIRRRNYSMVTSLLLAWLPRLSGVYGRPSL